MVENFKADKFEAKTEDSFGLELLIKSWGESMTDLTNQMQREFPFKSRFYTTLEESFKPFQERFQRALEWPFSWNQPTQFSETKERTDKESLKREPLTEMATAIKNWQTIAGLITSPGSISAMLKGVRTLPEIVTALSSSTMSGISEIHQKIVESTNRMGKSVEAYNFNSMDETLFQLWGQLYEKEFRKFLKIPQFGLAREYQEKSNDMVDKFNLVHNHLAQFLHLLALPFQRSAVVMQEQIQTLAERGELPEDPNVYYQMWIKILEGHFMTLFQTPEYIDALSNLLFSIGNFFQSREDVLEDILRSLPVASRSEMDDLAREFHQLKKEFRALKKKELLRDMTRNTMSLPKNNFPPPGIQPS